MKKQIAILVSSLILMMGCSTTKQPSETQYQAPIVNCSEDTTPKDLAFPPTISKTEYVALPNDEARIAYLRSHIVAYQGWAITASGKVKEYAILRAKTRDCLNNLRSTGVIK